MAPIKPPANEAYVGLEKYGSGSPGIGGTLKEEVGDFVVREVTPEGLVLDLGGDVDGDLIPGDYTHFTLVKENWDTMRAVKEISKRVGVSRNRFAFAGTKDRRAITAQRVSAYKVPVERLKEVDIKDIRLKDFCYSDENIGLGSLQGNMFTVRVRDVCEGAGEGIDAVASELTSGFPNYYGMQRFGEVRPVTHEVGLHILRGNFEGAVMCYLSKSFPAEDEGIRNLRDDLARTRDFNTALREFPTSLGYEKAMLNHLVQYSGDWIGAILTMPRTLQKMFVHAYQGYVFNRALSECIRRGLIVETLPLVGLNIEADDISARVLESDGIVSGDFKVRGVSELTSRGEYRECHAVASDFKFEVGGSDVVFDFGLGKGSYATVYIREFMKN
ncbi:MAG: tRNA pseudouridine(13) synthase TruD [Candidatus Altiarchaeota archaeon]